MTDVYHFSLGAGWLPAAKIRRELAKRGIDASLVNYDEPDGERRHWFAAENMGEPFNSGKSEEVERMLIYLGHLQPEPPEPKPEPKVTPQPVRLSARQMAEIERHAVVALAARKGLDLRQRGLLVGRRWVGWAGLEECQVCFRRQATGDFIVPWTTVGRGG
jgi:hypothetical protein